MESGTQSLIQVQATLTPRYAGLDSVTYSFRQTHQGSSAIFSTFILCGIIYA